MSGGPRDQQTAVIGAEIERGIGRTAAICGRFFSGRPIAERLAVRPAAVPTHAIAARAIAHRVEAAGLPGLAVHPKAFPPRRNLFPFNGCGMLLVKSQAVYQRAAVAQCHTVLQSGYPATKREAGMQPVSL